MYSSCYKVLRGGRQNNLFSTKGWDKLLQENVGVLDEITKDNGERLQETERRRDRQAKRNMREEKPEVRKNESVIVRKVEKDRDAKARLSTSHIDNVRIAERLRDTVARRNVTTNTGVRAGKRFEISFHQ